VCLVQIIRCKEEEVELRTDGKYKVNALNGMNEEREVEGEEGMGKRRLGRGRREQLERKEKKGKRQQ